MPADHNVDHFQQAREQAAEDFVKDTFVNPELVSEPGYVCLFHDANCWLVKIDEIDVVKRFAFRDFESRQKAKEAALEFRNEVLASSVRKVYRSRIRRAANK